MKTAWSSLNRLVKILFSVLVVLSLFTPLAPLTLFFLGLWLIGIIFDIPGEFEQILNQNVELRQEIIELRSELNNLRQELHRYNV